MLDRRAAQKLVEKYLSLTYPVNELVVIPEETLDLEYGWVFFYTTRSYLETGDINDMIAGNGPVLVEKENGKMTRFGTALPIEAYLEEYEKER